MEENLMISDPKLKRKKLYDGLYEKGLYTKSYADFDAQFSTPEKIEKLHGKLKERGLYTKEVTDFNEQFFSDKKKVDTLDTLSGLQESLPEDPLTKNIQASQKLTTSLSDQGFNEEVDKNKTLSELAGDAQAQENFRKLYESNPEAVDGFIKAAPDLLKDLVKSRNKSPEQIRDEFTAEQQTLGKASDLVSGVQDKAKFEDKERWEDNALTRAASATGSFNNPIVSMASSLPKFAGIATNAMESVLNYATGKEQPKIEDNVFYKSGKWMDDRALEIGITATDPRLSDSFLLNDLPSGFGSVASILATGNLGGAAAMTTQATKLGVKEAVKQTGKALSARPTLASGNMMGVDEFEQAIASGQSEGKSLINYFGGLGAGFTETIPLERALTRINKITGGKLVDIAKAGSVGALEEMTQEGIQQYITNKVAEGTYDPERDLFQDVWRSMRAGGAIGLLLPGIGVAMRSMSPEQRAKTKEELNSILKEKAAQEGTNVETPDGVLGNKTNDTAQGQPAPSEVKQEADNTGAEKQDTPEVKQQEPVDSGVDKKVGEGELKNNVNLQNEADQVPDGSPQEELGGSDEKDSISEGASRLRQVIQEARSKPKENTGGKKISERDLIDNDKKAIYEYARENNLWVDDVFTLGESYSSGNENLVLKNEKDGSVYKVNNLQNSKNSVDKLLQKVEDHNKLFPETSYEVVGFTGFENKGRAPHVEVILKQPFVNDTDHASEGEIDTYMQSIGFEKTGDAAYTNGEYNVSDLYPRNVLKDDDGTIYVIDNIIERVNDGAGIIPKVDQPIQHDAARAEEQGSKKPVQQGSPVVRQGEAEAATPVLDKIHKKNAEEIKADKKNGFFKALKKYSDIDPATPEIVVLKFFALNGRVKFDDVKRSSGYKKADTFGFTGDGPKAKSYHQLYEMALEETGMDEIDQSKFENMIDEIIQGGKKKVFDKLKEYIDNPVNKLESLEEGYEEFLKGQPDNSYLDELPSEEQYDEWFNELTDQEKQELYDDNEKAFTERMVGIPDARAEKKDSLGEEDKGRAERDRGREKEKEERLKLLGEAKASALKVQEDLSKAEIELRKLQESLAENLNANQIDAFGQNKPQHLFNDKADKQKIVDKKKKEVEHLQADLKIANQKAKDLEQAIDQNNLFDDNNDEDEDLPDWVIKAQLAENFDGRTQRQVETASRRLGKVALDSILNILKAKFPNFKVVINKQEVIDAYNKYVKDGVLAQFISDIGADVISIDEILRGKDASQTIAQRKVEAMLMLENGVDPEVVRNSTGWSIGLDGILRYETDDSKVKLTDNAKKIVSKGTGKMKLGDVVTDLKSLEAYKELNDIDVIFIRENNNVLGESGEDFITINLTLLNNEKDIIETIIHETQHNIQRIEKLAVGTSFGSRLKSTLKDRNVNLYRFRQMPEQERQKIKKDVFEEYVRYAGEIESRAAERRAWLTEEQRKKTPVFKGEQASLSKAIIDFGEKLKQQAGTNGLPNGFVYRDTIYINPETVRADTPIHEFGHIWNALAKIHNKALWRQGEALVKNSVYEKAVRENPAYAGLTDAQVYDEALAMAIGEKGALLANKSKFNQFFRDLFAWVKQKLGIKSELDFANMTLDDYVNMVAKELLTPGEISFLSDVGLPETATFRLKNYKTPQDAYKAYQERELINQVAAQDKDKWKMTVDGLWRRRFNSFMEGVQDQTRRLKEIQNNIVDYHVKLTIENIKADPTLSKKEKSAKIDALKNKRPAVERAIIPVSQDPHGLLDIMTGKVQYKINQIRDKYLGKPTGNSGYGTILDFLTQDAAWNGKTKFDENSIGYKLKEEGLSLLDLGFYAYVRHAEARNTKVNERRAEKGLEPLERPSGMTQTEINAFNKQIDKSGKRDVLDKYYQEMRNDLVVKPLQMKLEEGIIDQETYDRMIDYYGDTYVPLNVEEAALAGKDAPIGRLNKGVFGSNIKAIKGTDEFTYEDRINPFLQLIYNYEKTIADIERNKAIKAMAALIKEYPDARIWDTKAPKYDIRVDDNGEVEYVKQFPDAEIDTYGVPYMEGGKRRYVVLKDERLREIFMRSSSKRDEFLNLITSMTRGAFSYLRLAFTGLNPNFTFPNLLRDLQDAMVNLSEYSGIDKGARFWKGVRGKVIKGIGPSMKAVWKYERNGEVSGEYGQAYKEMKESGGDIAWLDYNSAEKFYQDTKAEVDKFLKTQDTKGERATNIGLMPVRAMLRYTLLANKSAEMGIRLSTYKTIREMGGSPEMAALAAKNVTVNFNKKGTFNPILSSLYLFLNAGVQGSTRLLTSLSRSKQSRQLVAAGIVGSIALRFLLDSIDEDEEEKRSDRLTKKDFAENAIFPSPFDKDDVIKIPISYNMRPFKAVGDGFYDVYKGRQTPSEAVANVVSTFINSFVPIIESKAIPTLAQPFVEIAANNRMYNDTPISPAKDFNLRKKDSEKYFGTPSGIAQYISENLADVNSGRDDVFEISPNTIDYVFDWTLGGLKSWYKTGDNIAKTFEGPNKFDINNTFVVSRLYADLEKQDWRDQVNYYALHEKSVRNEMSKENFLKMMKFGKRALDKGLISKTTFNRNKKEALKVQKDTYGNDYKEAVREFLRD